MAAIIEYSATHTFLECDHCESHPDPGVDFSFVWTRDHADTIMDTIEAMRDLHNTNHHEGNVTC